MEQIGQEIRWGIEQRLEFIEFKVFWEGGINRSALTGQFGVSIQQASNDIRRYEEMMPGNIVYDKSLKRYAPSATFTPQFLKPDADQYLNRLKGIADHTVAQAETWIAEMPAAESMPLPHRRVDVEVLRKTLNAIRRERALRIHYHSLNPDRTEPIWRWISPHAFANDGLRWHVRAFCHLDRRFKDFLLPRCLGADNDGSQEATSALDKTWQEHFDVLLVPNPKLSASQQAVVAHDYCMENGRISISVRKSFLYYFQKRLRLDVAQALDEPAETPVVIENKVAFDKALSEAKKFESQKIVVKN
jgi:predicted DNA-binding transcriptional regulator YafY